MPNEDLSPTDTFHIIGYTGLEIQKGSLLQLMDLTPRVLQSNEALWKRLGPLVPALNAGKVKRQFVEIYSVTPFLDEDAVPAEIRDTAQMAGGYMTVEFFNDTAYNLCREYQIPVPAIIGKTTRAELPPLPPLGITIRGVYYTAARAGAARHG